MGVHGLWTVVQPCARPIKLEALNKKRLAVDASIWIYQFLKAVRDKEGNALRNSHIVGFFRRICKLLYFGIKPVFVFDGGAPVLKRQTIANRKKRRECRRDDAVRTAGKLLAVQLQRTAEEEAANRRRGRIEEEVVPDNPVYVNDVFMTENEKLQTRSFKKKDAYHLPDMQASLEEMGAPNDPRIMSHEDLEEYARQFHQGEDINLYDFSKIDFDSPFFVSLPATDRYNILNAARLRSRLRMGYSKEQLDTMFPDRMAFSKFQIERVKERNDLTQRLMNINGMNGEDAMYESGQRIAGERGREYVLVKDDTIEGGWVLGVVGNKEGHEDKPIDVDQYGQQKVFVEKEDLSDDDDGGFEDVPIEGLNRLPKLSFLREGVLDESMRSQMRHRMGRGSSGEVDQGSIGLQHANDDSLFVEGDQHGFSWKHNHHENDDLFNGSEDDEDGALQRAIAMSLESGTLTNDDDLPEISLNRNHAPQPTHEASPNFADQSDDEEMDFAAALAQSKRIAKVPSKAAGNPFDGPLPFESLRFGKPSNKEKQEGQDVGTGPSEKEPTDVTKDSQILPPWFSGPIQSANGAEFIADEVDDHAVKKRAKATPTPDHVFVNDEDAHDVDVAETPLDSKEVIDLESTPERAAGKDQYIQASYEASPIKEATPVVANAPESENTEASAIPKEDVIQEEKYQDSMMGDTTSHVDAQADMTQFEASPSPEFEDVALQPEIIPVEEPPAADEVDLPEELFDQEGFSDPEDEDLIQQLAAEGEEHVRFTAILNSASHVETPFDYEQELKQLRSQQKKDRRDADEVSQVMITECQQLLTLFGLPYVTAPMEAEAQCAELVSLGLVDGIITDDSDIFLFGGTRVYKNMFNQSKFVECYLTTDLEKEYSLFRTKLIRLAHLLGSDYTEGIPGIGPVTALEVLTEFATLEEFRDWWTQVQTSLNMADDTHAAFYKKFKKHAAKIFLPPSFPDPRVDVAYLEPEVDSDPSPFQWGVPDLHGLRNYLMSTIGWSQERTDEVLVPVIRDMNRREQEGTQSNITSFFSGPLGAGAFAPRVRSGGQTRMEKAFSRLRQQAGPVEQPDSPDVEGNPVAVSALENEAPLKNSSGKDTGTKRGRRGPRNAKDGVDGAGDNTASNKKRRTRRGA
ncbi:DNA excision repair protein Rad2 [Aspergillus sclerotioniger CBS 115572]|uniref:DNA excision repair protein Rad2 n=1 Tax=Aspergillus sclerotioniger CBS 115572 TaxID=1450535 RepID=A0A317X5Y5_9EURO|nr:DNA excision repair protein Rad2 [Aspergillus sclerotioniger CBS 115572]PWY94024.1 DNA excision repair protein Rad2 [Aspergillus sclerotioniger CBS 115572]